MFEARRGSAGPPSGACPPATRSWPSRARPRPRASRCGRQLAQLQNHEGAWQDTVPYPVGDHPFPGRLAALAEMLDRGLPLRVVAMDANGGYDTHEDQAATLGDELRPAVGLARRLPGRPRGARDRRSRARARVERVRPPPGGERLRHRPRRGRHEPADGHARVGPDGRRVPRASPGSTRTTTCATRSTSARVYRGLTEQWLAGQRRRHHPRRVALRRARADPMRARAALVLCVGGGAARAARRGARRRRAAAAASRRRRPRCARRP